LRKQWVKENKKYIPWERLQETFDKVDWFLIALPERVTARQTITSLKSHRHPNPNSEKKRKQLLNEIEEASKHTPVDNIGFVFADDVDFYLKLFDAMIIINLSEIVREVRA
jgi:hypothetical protein